MENIFSSLWFQLLALAGLIFVILIIKVRVSFNYWKTRGVPYSKPVFLVGNIAERILARKSEMEVYERLYNQFYEEKYFGFYNFLHPFFVVKDPNLIRNILIKDFQHFDGRGFKFNLKKDPLAEHLLFLSGSKWKYLRTKLTPTFTSGKMKQMFNLILHCSDDLLVHIQKNVNLDTEVDIKNLCANYTTDAIGSCVFGLQMNSLNNKNSQFRQIGKVVTESSIRMFIFSLINDMWPNLSVALQLKFIPQKIEDFFVSTIKETMEYRDKNNIQRPDFIQLLMPLRKSKEGSQSELPASNATEDDGERKFDETFIAAQAFIFLVAGFETSSSAMSHCLYLLALNPDVQEKLRAEINTVLLKHGKITYEAINDMKYMDMVIDETLRLYPGSPTIIRSVTKQYVVPNTSLELEEDTRIMIPIYSIQRDKKYFPDPLKFDPERFNEENKANITPFTYLPFGDGPRICIGMRFAFLQMKIGLTRLLSNYSFQVSENTTIPLELDPFGNTVLMVTKTLWLKLKLIKKHDTTN